MCYDYVVEIRYEKCFIGINTDTRAYFFWSTVFKYYIKYDLLHETCLDFS